MPLIKIAIAATVRRMRPTVRLVEFMGVTFLERAGRNSCHMFGAVLLMDDTNTDEALGRIGPQVRDAREQAQERLAAALARRLAVLPAAAIWRPSRSPISMPLLNRTR